jgi:hypothetical protein
MVANQNYSTSFSVLHINFILTHPAVLCYIESKKVNGKAVPLQA